uniref:Uncharacterized protein n=1 Tax=Aegilops tauschii subsp. strangulata TaxID=200361 RepID=A0A453R658_AEGTS
AKWSYPQDIVFFEYFWRFKLSRNLFPLIAKRKKQLLSLTYFSYVCSNRFQYALSLIVPFIQA